MFKRIKSLININNGVLAVALLIALSWVWGTVEAIQRNFSLQQEVDSLAQEIAYYELENDTLKFHQKYYQTEEYLDLSARERLNKAGPGEKLLILPANTVKETPDPVATTSQIPITERSNIDQWLYFLFGDKQ